MTIRELDPHELEAADGDLTEWLVGARGSLATTYPQVFRPDTGTVSLGAFEDGVLQSHAAVRRVRLVTSRGELDASLVGLVATDPAARGEQLASRLLHTIADRELADGRELVLLWSDRWDFYAKLGYAAAGVQAEVELARPQTAGAAACRPLRAGDVEALTVLHTAKPWRVVRDVRETELLLCGTTTDCFVLERDGAVVAYACCGKGIDFAGWWHELGGTDADVAALLPAAMAALGQDRATVLVPPYRSELLERLAGHASRIAEGVVALCKPLTERGCCELFVDGLDSI